MKASDLKFFDQRTFKRNLELGLIKKEDYQKHLKTLPDEDGNFDSVSFEDLDPMEETVSEDLADDIPDLNNDPEAV